MVGADCEYQVVGEEDDDANPRIRGQKSETVYAPIDESRTLRLQSVNDKNAASDTAEKAASSAGQLQRPADVEDGGDEDAGVDA